MADAYPELHLLIAGAPRQGGGRRHEDVVNPATEEVLGHLPHATAQDLDDALAAAERGFAHWRAVAPQERGRIIKRGADLLRERASMHGAVVL